MPRYSDEDAVLRSCTLRTWKDQVLAENSAKEIVGRWPKVTPQNQINEDLRRGGYAVRRSGATTLGATVVVTRVAPGEAVATPLRVLRQQAEEAAARGESRIPLSQAQRERALVERELEASEHAAEARAESFAEARFGGALISDALDEADYVATRARRRGR